MHPISTDMPWSYHISTDVIWSLMSVSLFDAIVSCAKTDGQIEVPFFALDLDCVFSVGLVRLHHVCGVQ